MQINTLSEYDKTIFSDKGFIVKHNLIDIKKIIEVHDLIHSEIYKIYSMAVFSTPISKQKEINTMKQIKQGKI